MADKPRVIRLRHPHIDRERSTPDRIVVRAVTQSGAVYALHIEVDQPDLSCCVQHFCRLIGDRIACERAEHRFRVKNIATSQHALAKSLEEPNG